MLQGLFLLFPIFGIKSVYSFPFGVKIENKRLIFSENWIYKKFNFCEFL